MPSQRILVTGLSTYWGGRLAQALETDPFVEAIIGVDNEEPVVELEVTAPSRFTGTLLGDLNTKRARIEHQDSLPGDLAVIRAKVPLAEVMRYAAQLGSMTQGQGSYSMEFSHYDQVPGNVQQQIVSKAKVAKDEDE